MTPTRTDNTTLPYGATPQAARLATLATRAGTITEAQLQGTVEQMATLLGWRWYHTRDSRRSVKGFPDLVMIHPGQGRILWVELKSERGRLSREQRAWINDLDATGAEVHVWRPADLVSGRVLAVLQNRAS
ncbi:MAG: VRR-NUC domain-containing protein [Micrococcus sp.]|nr:VRR-NUC domain-containing protein [Micrococcus sp.]